jgi:hypothetical protein
MYDFYKCVFTTPTTTVSSKNFKIFQDSERNSELLNKNVDVMNEGREK